MRCATLYCVCAKVTKRTIWVGALYAISFIFLIGHLNLNVRTFSLTQSLQTITLDVQARSRDVKSKEMEYYSRTNLHHVHDYAVKQLGMKRQSAIRMFSNDSVMTR